MPQISAHFSLAELTITQQTGPDGKVLVNAPGLVELLYLRVLAETVLEPIRTLWSRPVLVTSAFRSDAVELKVSGKVYGQHRLGQAADIQPVGGLSLDEAYRAIFESSIPFDQLLLERAGETRWIHVSCSPLFMQPRRQALVTNDNGFTWAVYQPPPIPPAAGSAATKENA